MLNAVTGDLDSFKNIQMNLKSYFCLEHAQILDIGNTKTEVQKQKANSKAYVNVIMAE